MASHFLGDKDHVVEHFFGGNRTDLTIFRGAFGFFNSLRQHEGGDTLLETVVGVSLLINSLLWILAFVAFLLLIVLILSAFFLLVF